MKSETDVMAATSAAAVETLPTFDGMGSKELAHFMETGEHPFETKETKDTKSDAAAAPEKDMSKDESGVASDATKKDTETQELTPNEHTNRRIRRQAAQIKQLQADLEKERQSKSVEKPQETNSAADDPNEPDIDELLADGTPKFKSVKEFLRVYKQHLIDTGVKPAVAEILRQEREALQKADQQAEAEEVSEKISSTFKGRLDVYRKTLVADTMNADIAKVKAFVDQDLPNRGPLADFIVDSEVGPQLVHYFAEHPNEFEALAELSPLRAMRELVKLESSESVKGPAPKTRTAAKKIGSEVGGRTAASDEDDAIAQAAASGNQKEYTRLMNKREAAENRR